VGKKRGSARFSPWRGKEGPTLDDKWGEKKNLPKRTREGPPCFTRRGRGRKNKNIVFLCPGTKKGKTQSGGGRGETERAAKKKKKKKKMGREDI